jgi:hypothetical protein
MRACIKAAPRHLSARFVAELTKRNFRPIYFHFIERRANTRRPAWLVGCSTRTQEDIMHTCLRTGALAVAFVGGIGFAVAQTMSGGAQEKLNLSQSKEGMVRQGLANEPAQSAPNFRGQVGSKLPDSVNARALPNQVTDQVPETKTYLFVKLPDRILLIDPDSKLVAEIVPAAATTGQDGSAPAGSPSR